MTTPHLETMARTLEASGEYQILRRLRPHQPIQPPPGTPTRSGLVVDVETTGLNHDTDEIIELAMTPFTYGLDGTIYAVGESFQRLREPSKPISPQITALTGLTNEMVAGHTIDPAEVDAFVAPTSLCIAHNASFDRRFVERFNNVFATKPWACSLSQIDWRGEGFEGGKLAYLAQASGFFYERHRAMHDCLATIALLAKPLPKSRVPALYHLLTNARLTTWRIYAEHAPYDLKDLLKARGYRWNGAPSIQPRAWYTDLPEEFVPPELHYLRTEIYQSSTIEPRVTRIDAYKRFSDRI